ncbi:MAG: AEC family transporter [Clostridia bacterium]
MDAFLIVSLKVGVMVLLIITGVVMTKMGKISKKGSEDFTWFLLNIVTPCVIIDAFANLDAGELMPTDIAMGTFLSVCSIMMGAAISPLFFRKQSDKRKKVLRFATIFSNTGFMGIPLASAVLGNRGVIFASIYVAVFNFLVWTVGYAIMSGEKKIQLKKILFNPGTIGFFTGLLIYFTGVKLPTLITEPITSLSTLNMPIAMIILGYFMANIDILKILKDIDLYKVCGIRLILIPLLSLCLVVIVKPEYTLFVSTLVQSCTPAATSTVLFAAITKADAELASASVVATTIFSLLTVPIFIMFAQIIANQVLV